MSLFVLILFLPCLVYVAAFSPNSNYSRGLHCKEVESSLLSKLFRDTRSIEKSFCPKETWLESMRDWNSEHGKSSGVFVNIGFNKGYNFAIWMNLLVPWSFMTAKVWHEGLLQFMNKDKEETCGFCHDCETVISSKSSEKERNESSTEFVFIGVDINRRNIDLVSSVAGCSHSRSWLQGCMVPSSEGSLSLYLIQAAGAEHSGHVQVPRWNTSDERIQLHGNFSAYASSEYSSVDGQSAADMESIPAVPVDQLMHNLTYAQRHNSSLLSAIYNAYFNHDAPPPSPQVEKTARHHHHLEEIPSAIDILMIDTEGHDALVIRGAKHLLKRHAIRCLIFEYHELLPWSEMKLEETVRYLDVHGMDCFFEGAERLWPISGSCWHENYEFHLWSNVMCVLREDPWRQVIQKYIVSFEWRDSHVPEGSLVQIRATRYVYLIENGLRRRFNGGKGFLAAGYSFDDVKIIDDLFFNLFPDGQSLG